MDTMRATIRSTLPRLTGGAISGRGVIYPVIEYSTLLFTPSLLIAGGGTKIKVESTTPDRKRFGTTTQGMGSDAEIQTVPMRIVEQSTSLLLTKGHAKVTPARRGRWGGRSTRLEPANITSHVSSDAGQWSNWDSNNSEMDITYLTDRPVSLEGGFLFPPLRDLELGGIVRCQMV